MSATGEAGEFKLGQLLTEYRRRLALHRLKQGERPDWMHEVMRPLAEELGRASGLTPLVGGPRGIGVMVTVDLRDLNDNSQEYLVFTPRHEGDSFELHLVNQHSDTGRLPPGTVGHTAGLHHVSVALTPQQTAREILELHRSFTPVQEEP